jgi:hypothetical protein
MIVTAVVAGFVLLTAPLLRAYAAITLMSRYRVEQYLATAASRRLYWISVLTPLVTVTALVVLAFCSRLWWVEAASALFFLLVALKTVQALRMRFSGKYVEFYRRHHWS